MGFAPILYLLFKYMSIVSKHLDNFIRYAFLIVPTVPLELFKTQLYPFILPPQPSKLSHGMQRQPRSFLSLLQYWRLISNEAHRVIEIGPLFEGSKNSYL